MRVKIIALGNKIMGDDYIGVYIGERLLDQFQNLDIVLLEEGGISLLDHIDVEEVVIIDSFETENVGEIRLLDIKEASKILRGTHYMGIWDVIELSRKVTGLPRKVYVIGIGVRDTRTIKEGLSNEVQAKVDQILKGVKEELFKLIDGVGENT